MRGTIPGLPSPHPLAGYLPALLQQDSFAAGFVAGLDEVLAPIFNNLDNLDAYLDAQTTPEDFLPWLAGWTGVELDDNWPLARRRAFVHRAVDLYRLRGTVLGLAALVEVVTGGKVEIIDSGGSAWSNASGAEPPGRPGAGVLVRVTVADPTTVDLRALDALVAGAKPAHAAHQVEVVGG
jgi:phage tail-like protein